MLLNEQLAGCTVYDLLPVSQRLVVIDARLPVKKAFLAMAQNGLPVVPVTRAGGNLMGMLTCTDFIELVLDYCDRRVLPEDIHADLLNCRVDEYFGRRKPAVKPGRRRQRSDGSDISHSLLIMTSTQGPVAKSAPKYANIVEDEPTALSVDAWTIPPTATAYEASMRFVQFPMIQNLLLKNDEDGSLVALLPRQKVLQYLASTTDLIGNEPPFSQPISELGLIRDGDDLATVTLETPIDNVLRTLIDCATSAVAVLDSDGRCVDIMERVDILRLFPTHLTTVSDNRVVLAGDVHAPIQSLLMSRTQPTRVPTCTEQTTLRQIMQSLRTCTQPVLRFLAVDSMTGRFRGLVSTYDILHLLINNNQHHDNL